MKEPKTLEIPIAASFHGASFLKLGSIGMAGLLLDPMMNFEDLAPNQLGRVAEMKSQVYDRPSLEGHQTNVYWKDMIIPITSVTVGDAEPSYNRIWYRIGDEGFVHSGSIQPVQTHLQEPDSNIPITGALVEVTVPYTDIHWGPGKNNQFAYRFYYETTHWAKALVQDNQGNYWYQILEDKWDLIYYAPANHLRIVPKSELSPLSPGITIFGKTNRSAVDGINW